VALVFGEFSYEPEQRELRCHGAILKVDPKQLDLLGCFLQAPGVLLHKRELLRDVWGGRATADSALSVAVAKLRKVLGHAPGKREVIENRYGRGYRFLLPVSVVTRPELAVAPESAPLSAAEGPLVGRVDSLRGLEAALSLAIAGHGSLCALLGEPGIGKTRLAEALERRAQQRGMRSAWGRFFAAEGAPPLWPLAQVLRELNRDGLADEALRLVTERSARRAPDALQPGAGSELTQEFLYDMAAPIHRTIDAITQTLIRLSQVQPILIVLDDLQWADAASLRLLSHLASELSRARLLVIATARSSAPGMDSGRNRELLRLLSQYKCERIELQRLRESDVAEYIAATFGVDGARLGHTVFARSAGNPFFMIELLRPFLGLPAPEPEQLRLSGLALDLVRQRLAALPEAARSVLSAAAVIGHDFDLGLLSAVTGRGPDELLEALDSSLANDTVIASSHVPGSYAFEHELIREALYGDLAASERCRLHLRVGAALQRRSLATAEQVTDAELALHFLSALPQGEVSVAIAHARAAAAAAKRLASYADAGALLRRAFDSLKFWAEPDPETVTGLLLELAMVERALADPAYVEHLKQGLLLAREHRFGPLLTTAGRLLSPSPGLLSRADAASVLEAAAEILPASDISRRAIVLAHLAWTPPNSLSARRVNALLGEAESLAERANDAEASNAVRDARLFFRAGPESHSQAEALADEIDRELKSRPETTRSARLVVTSTLRLILAMQRGDLAGLQRALQARASLLEAVNNRELDWHHERMLLALRMNRGDFTGVAADLEQLRQQAERLRLQAWPALWALDQSLLLCWTGDVSELAARMRPALALAANESPTTLSRKLRYMVEFGFLEDARSALAGLSSDALRDLPRDRDYLGVAFQLAMVSAAVGSREQSQVLYELLGSYADFYAVGISFHCDGSMSHCLGALARALGQRELARAHFASAAERNSAFELHALALQSRFELAKLLVAADSDDERARGRELLARVHAEAEQRGLWPLARASAAQ
jgi:DNA-binding winged helix-turn-helix (wHTH) protein